MTRSNVLGFWRYLARYNEPDSFRTVTRSDIMVASYPMARFTRLATSGTMARFSALVACGMMTR